MFSQPPDWSARACLATLLLLGACRPNEISGSPPDAEASTLADATALHDGGGLSVDADLDADSSDDPDGSLGVGSWPDSATQDQDATALDGGDHDAAPLAPCPQLPALAEHAPHWIAFLSDVEQRGQGRLYLAPAAPASTESAHAVMPAAYANLWVAEWSFAPNGKHLALRVKNDLQGSRLFIVDMEAETPWTTTTALSEEAVAPDGVSDFEWSEDGRHLAILVRTGGQGELRVSTAPFSPSNTRRVGELGQVRPEDSSVAWAGSTRLVFADRRTVRYADAGDGFSDVHELSISASRPFRLHDSAQASHIFGSQVLNHEQDAHFVIPLGGSEAQFLGNGHELIRSLDDRFATTFGPLGNTGTLIDLANGERAAVHARMTAHLSSRRAAPSHSAPSSHFVTAGSDGRTLELWDLSGSKLAPKTIALGESPSEIYGFDLSQDGSTLLTWTRQGLFELEFAAGALPSDATPLVTATGEGTFIRGARVSPNAAWTAYWGATHSKDAVELTLANSATSKQSTLHLQTGARRVWALRPDAAPSFSDDSSLFAFITGGVGEPSWLHVRDVAGGSERVFDGGTCALSPGPGLASGEPVPLCSGILELAFQPTRPTRAQSLEGCQPPPSFSCTSEDCGSDAGLPIAPEPPTALTDGLELMYWFLDRPDPDQPRSDNPDRAFAMLEGCWLVPRSEQICTDAPLTWLEDPFNEKYWRIMVHSLRVLIDPMAQYRWTGDPAYRDVVIEAMRSFFAHHASAPASWTWDRHTTAFRGMTLTNYVAKLRALDALPEDLRALTDSHLVDAGAFLELPKNFEANQNHGVTEAGSLLLIAQNYPNLAQSAAWRELATQRLTGLMNGIVGEDGVSLEQAVFYHFYNLNFFWQIGSWAKKHEVALASSFDTRLEAMVRYGQLVVQPNLLLPMLEASLLQDLATYQEPVYDDLEFSHPELRFIRSQGNAGTSPPASDLCVLFPDSGKAILRSGFGTSDTFVDQAHLVFDVGYWNTDNSQLDALNLHLYAAGRTLLTDSGLFTKEESTEAFAYYFGTRAHNTVVVDGADQAKGAARAGLTAHDAGWAYQSGAHRLYPGVDHQRAVMLIGRHALLVVDRLIGQEPHDFTQLWHFMPWAKVSAHAAGADVTDPAGKPVLTLAQAGSAGEVQVIAGQANPRQGWYSERYEFEQPAPVASFTTHDREATFATVLLFGDLAGSEPAASLTELSDDRISLEATFGDVRYRWSIDKLLTPEESTELVVLTD